MKKMSALAIIILLAIHTFAVILPQVKASSQTIEWKGWWVGDVMVSEAYIGETVTAQVRILNEPSGYYRVRIMRDIASWEDIEVEKLEFDYDGGDHIYSLSFTTLIASGEGATRGYHVDVYKKEWWGWAEKWTMPSSYPPRLKVLARELWIKLAEAPKAIGGGGDVVFNENALYIIAGGGTRDFWKLDLSSLSWTTLASVPEEVGHGGGMTFDGERYIYVVRGTSLGGLKRHNDFWRYDLDQNLWEKLPDTPEGVASLGSIVYANGYVYLRPGGSFSAGFYGYNIKSQTWETKTSGPRVAVEVGPSTAMTYDGERYIYTFQGGQNIPPADFMYDEIWRYDIWNDEWLDLGHREEHDRADLLYVDSGLYALNKYSIYNFEFFDLSSKEWFGKPDIPCGLGIWNPIGPGASLAYDGAQYIYALNGGLDKRIWRYRIYRTPDFYISAKAKQICYKPQETTETAVTVKNNRGVRTTFWLGVSFKDPTGEFTKYNEQISITPSSATLDPSQSTTFSVTWTVPSDAPIGYYQIAVNCWKDSTFKQSYIDNLDWAFIFYVYQLNILTPTTINPATAGGPSDPSQIQVSVEWIPQWLLDPMCIKTPTFSVEIDHQQATYELTDPFMRLFGIYTLKVTPPTQPSEGLYDLNVTATFDQLVDSDVEPEAIRYIVGPPLEPIEKGLAWLRTRQYGDGSWRGNVGVTSLAVLAFLNAGYDETDTTVSKAINYMLNNVRPDGSIYGSYPTYETSLAILALVATRNDSYKTTIENAKNWLVNSQWDESCIWGSVSKDDWYYGGFGYGWGYRPDLSNSQFALLALDAAGLPKDHPLWKKAQVFLHRCQNINFPITLNIEGIEYTVQPYNLYGGYDGGFIYYPGVSLAGGQKSYGSMTGAGIWGLLLSGVPKTDARVVAAMNWVKNYYTWDINPGLGWSWPYYYYLSMSKALTMYGQTTIDGHDWYQELYDKMVEMQIDAGSGQGYWSTPVENFDPELTTAYAILSLQTKAVAPPVHRLSYLTFILRSNCLIRIIDPEGNLVGYNYMTGLGENNVPRAVYSGPFFEPQYIIIVNPQAGTYRLELIGVSEGPYELTIQGNYGEEVTDTFEYAGEIRPGELHGCDVTVTAIVGPIDVYANPPEFEERIDNIPPTTTLEIGEPKYFDPIGNIYVASGTPLTLTAEDNPGGTGVAKTFYRIYNSSYDTGWMEYSSPLHLIGLSDGEYSIDFYSVDNAGNVEPTNTVTVILDNAPPTTTLTVGEPKYTSDTTYVTPDTPFTLEATDAGSGVHSIVYRVFNATYDSGWIPYTEPFHLTSLADGTYTIEYYSTDNVQNIETTQLINVTLFSWNYIFTDSYGRGTVLKINLAHKFFQFITPDKDYGIREATYMRQCGRTIIIHHYDGELRLITVTVDTRLDFCVAIAWDKQTRKQYFLIDKVGKE